MIIKENLTVHMALADNWNTFIRIHGGEVGARDVFEKAMLVLLRAENPDNEVHLVEASRGDSDIDVYVHHANGIDIYQCKFYMGVMISSRWADVRKSIARAMVDKGVEVLRWFLCLPREMRVNDVSNDLETWNHFKEENKLYNVEINLIDGDEIIERMRLCDRLTGTDFIDQYFAVPPSVRHALYEIPKLLSTYMLPGPEVGLVGRDDVLNKCARCSTTKPVLPLSVDLEESARSLLCSRFAKELLMMVSELHNLDETLIPKELRKHAIDLPVRGVINGRCYLIPYDGRLKRYTNKKTITMIVPQLKNGQEKRVFVSVVEEDRIIYMSGDMFKIYEEGLRAPEGIELRDIFK